MILDRLPLFWTHELLLQEFLSLIHLIDDAVVKALEKSLVENNHNDDKDFDSCDGLPDTLLSFVSISGLEPLCKLAQSIIKVLFVVICHVP